MKFLLIGSSIGMRLEDLDYLKPHMGLEGKTLSEVAGIKAEGNNKWITLI